jgi:archaellum component FlaF (FlaF/FlaG flagellin family)
MKTPSISKYTQKLKIGILIAFIGTFNNALAGLVVALSLQAPLVISPGEVTNLEITMANNNTGAAITALSFNEALPGTLPNGLKIAGIPTNTCGGTLTTVIGAQGVQLTGGMIPADNPVGAGTCIITLPVTAGTSSGSGTTYTYTIPVGAVTGTDGAPQTNTGLALNQSVGVLAMSRPIISKNLISSTIILDGSPTTLDIVINNPDSNASLTGVSISDTFPVLGGGGAIIEVASPTNTSINCTNGGAMTFAPVAGDIVVNGTNGTIPPNSSCTLSVDVVARHTNGLYQTPNQTNRIQQDNDFDNDIGIEPANDATDTFKVRSPLQVSKAFTNASMVSGSSDTLTITLTNNGQNDLTITSFIDDIDNGVMAGLVPTNVSNTCGSADSFDANTIP